MASATERFAFAHPQRPHEKPVHSRLPSRHPVHAAASHAR